MSAKHTPGPLKVCKQDHAIEILGDAFVVADVYIPQRGCAGPRNLGEAKATANLFAASPDLLKALKALVNEMDSRFDYEAMSNAEKDAMRMADAAISKAEART